MRVVAGLAGGRTLVAPKGSGTRPTSDRVREALFSSLGPLDGARVLDAYAGSGALGLEALSRGAAHVLLVERDRAALAAVRANVAALGLAGAEVVARDLLPVLAARPAEAYDLVLLDPPYADDPVPVLDLLVVNGWLAEGADLVVERSTRDPEPAWPRPLQRQRSRAYGETTLWYVRAP